MKYTWSLALSISLGAMGFPVSFPTSVEEASPQTSRRHIVVAGRGIGPAHLSDDRASVIKSYPLKTIDDERKGPGTRSVLVWHDEENGKVIGELMFYFKGQDLFQIECGSPRYRTVEGIAVGSQPSNIKKDYQRLSAFQLWNSGSDEVGGRDLIFWVDKNRGIAFQFYYDRRERRRLVGRIYVFPAGTDFYPGETWLPAERWRPIPPNSLEPPSTSEPPPL